MVLRMVDLKLPLDRLAFFCSFSVAFYPTYRGLSSCHDPILMSAHIVFPRVERYLLQRWLQEVNIRVGLVGLRSGVGRQPCESSATSA